MRDVTVIKENEKRQETWRYPAKIIADLSGGILLEAFFNRDRVDVHGLLMVRGDRFVEAYYNDRWYNINEIYGQDGTFKGWYCNVSTPVEIRDDEIRYADLALDLLVFPDGRQMVLDEDEFAALDLDEETRQHALQGLSQLQVLFQPPVTFRLEQA